MTVTIELSDEQAAALERDAATHGMTVESWIQAIARGESSRVITSAALDWSQCPAVESDPGKLSGAWVFKGTRMPVSAVFENLEDGLTINELVELYDGLTREQIQAVLD